ncbi:unnamed protein product [Candidula unifasciata]|uniref:Spermatogenesis-associated protein 20-like TRX domain-containing protein n=1 Tax=Candidula unifasciata TaxID=100452 RepID=A0A8S3ZPC8_9EUPU|nr:unnamed protein product [Candidula unifasciata]
MRMSSSTASQPQFTNRLAQEKSPYLLQHAHNPVDWYPWGEEAFQKAREDNKPIFLSVGYSTCHWCHVMEHESFENVEIGQLLNENFVSIKVDREERPDVDRVYMTFVQATTGSGGWPMSVWLTPDLKPFVGGTYFPPDDRYYNRPGFKSILHIISKKWKENKSEIENQSTQILDALTRGMQATDKGSPVVPTMEASDKGNQMLKKRFDQQYGGFGSAPKFPQPVIFNFLFRYFHRNQTSESGTQALHMSLFTLTKMAYGGIHDHISQGFHRYSTDRIWHVPHFEKMLYDQGQLACSYSDAYQITRDDLYEATAQDIFTYVRRDLSHPVRKPGVTLSDIFCHYYNVKENGNVDPLQDPHDELKKKNVLLITSTVEDTASEFELSVDEVKESLEKSRQILYNIRQKRPRPHLDSKMVAAWNGLMISGFARGGQVLGDPTLTDRAVKAALFLKQYMFESGTGILLRSCYTSDRKTVSQIDSPIRGFADDYAYVIRGLLDLYESCYDDQWIAWAEQLQMKQNQLFWDEDGGGYFSSQRENSSIVLQIKEDQDGAEPSPNSVSAMNLLRLSTILDNTHWREMAERIFKVFAERIENTPVAVPELVSAVMFYHSSPKQIIIVGDRNGEDTKGLIKTLHKHYLPHKVLLVSDGSTDSFLREHVKILSSLVCVDGKATAYVCENFTCSLPVNSCDELEKLLVGSLPA